MYDRYTGKVCISDGCDRKPRARQLCNTHYAAANRRGDSLPASVREYEPCSVAGCDRQKSGRGLCAMHYKRATRPKRPSPELRFWRYVDWSRPGGCWEWTGALTRGYGSYKANYVSYGAHRYAWWLRHGAWPPEGLHLDHLCRNPRCVNPDHLEPVTCAENLERSPIAPSTINAAKTHCIHGHPFDSLNTYVNRHGWRSCRTCKADSWRKNSGKAS